MLNGFKKLFYIKNSEVSLFGAIKEQFDQLGIDTKKD